MNLPCLFKIDNLASFSYHFLRFTVLSNKNKQKINEKAASGFRIMNFQNMAKIFT